MLRDPPLDTRRATDPGTTAATKFSAIIPLYNGEATIASTLESVLAQTFAPVDIVVVDDGSTDNGAEIVARYQDRVTLLRMEGNSGVQMARNYAIAQSGGNWIALCDQDDLWAPDYLARVAALVAAEPQLEFVFTNFRRTFHDVPEPHTKFDQAPPTFWQEAERRIRPEGWVFNRQIAGLTFVWHPMFPSGTVLTRQLIDAVGGFDPTMRGRRPEDGEFTLRCLYRAVTGAIPDPLVTIRRHDLNFSRDTVLGLVDEVEVLQFIRAHHEEARPFWPVIDNQIRRRRIQAAHGAFARRDHALLRRLLADIDPVDRSVVLRAKAIVASLPSPLDIWTNSVLQRLSMELRQQPRRDAGNMPL